MPLWEDVMHGTQMKYLLVAGGGLVVGLFLAGTPLRALLPYLLLLACPLMMVVMMHGMGGHGDGHRRDAAPHEPTNAPTGVQRR